MLLGGAELAAQPASKARLILYQLGDYAKQSGVLIGQIFIRLFIELGLVETCLDYFMDANHCGRGSMTQAVQAVTRHPFEVLAVDYDYIVATTQPTNTSFTGQ